MCLFNSFVKEISDKKSQDIPIDQDLAIAKALVSQQPKTHHHLCVQHMYQNATKCLSDVFGRCRSFTIDSNSFVYDHNNDEDFLNAWEQMLDKYGLRINSWLQRQFELRGK